ncbi:hypothetical protein V3C99_017980 [Haemonchus contortus]
MRAQCALEGGGVPGIPLYTKVLKESRSPELRHRAKTRDAIDYGKKSKIRWAVHVMRYSDVRWTGRLLTGSLGTSSGRHYGRQLDVRLLHESSERKEC